MKNAFLMTAAVMLVATGAGAVADQAKADASTPAAVVAEKAPPEKHIDLVICLDTSGSMSGLIESAKQKLWAVVNELATAKPRPRLRVALYHYGNSGLSSDTGWVQQLSPLTDDLDTVYARLFELRTRGGTEYVARVVRTAVNELEWNTRKDTLRVMYVAGNEAATQDKQFPLRDVCKAAATEGIIINTIFCGSDSSGRRTGWQDAAEWADGQYASIDQDRGTVVVSTKHDKELAELSAKLNTTYVPYGGEGEKKAENQAAQDTNAASLSPAAAADRAGAKATGLYRNAGWDLVDAVSEGKVELEKVPEKDLPENMQKMKPAERKKYVDEQARSRKAIQARIKDLAEKRDAEIKRQIAEKGLDDSKSLDTALRKSIRSQAEQKGLEFEKKPEATPAEKPAEKPAETKSK